MLWQVIWKKGNFIFKYLLKFLFKANVLAGVGLAMLGKFCVSASYAILRLYSNEIFPTSIRSSCMGACSMVSRLGVIIAPLVISLVI